MAGLGAALMLLSGAAHGDAPMTPPTAYGARAGYAVHLLEGARYGEATDAAEALVDSSSEAAPSYEVRGTMALYVGNIARAQDDFRVASLFTPSEPTVQYGRGLCALFGGRLDEAQAEFDGARQAPGLTLAQAVDVDTARAYVLYLRGNRTDAQALATPAGDDAMRQELLAMIAAQDRPADGEALLKAFLNTASGAPRVREDEGVRGLFEAGHALEPSVTEPALQHTYAARLADQMAYGQRRRGNTVTVTGTVTLSTKTGDTRGVVSFSVDGQVAAMINQPPFAYFWDTRRVANGFHTIQIETDDANGQALATQTKTVRVQNAHPLAVSDGHGGMTDAEYAQTQARLWDLLRLRPAHKAAEWALADRLASRGDEAGADAHRLIAAALDPDYKDARHVARLLLGGRARRVALVGKLVPLASAPPTGLWRGDPTRREVALTFDDGPNPQKTPLLLNALDKAQAPATFFVVGARAEAAPDLLRRMARSGYDVENHSYTHPDMDQAEPIVVEEEVLRANVIIEALTGHMPRFFRPPGGDGGPAVLQLAQEYGLTGAFWTEDALHYEDLATPEGLVHYVIGHLHPGSIVLMHNGPDATITAIPALVAALRAQGYQIVTLSQMTRGGIPMQASHAGKGAKE